MRKCECGWQTEAGDPATELVQYSDHSTEHNPSPAQWAEAYSRMRMAEDKAKRLDKWKARREGMEE